MIKTKMERTKLSAIREPTKTERKNGAEIVFERYKLDDKGLWITYTIFACKCYESWEQWGAPVGVLGDNVETVERWRRNKD